ncbi:hypothetical protein Tco_0770090 [Tanacetum coccineum]|uniref:Uncharacterized protein n=1 Tax=Tanacetum coccineum TaxID=301880 RepID=A0ABQ4ZB77_9ASTR
MATLESCPKHNIVAYLEKTDGNVDFSMSAKSKTINNVRYINAKVAGKPVTISEASIRNDLLFDDVDGIDVLNNQAIFDAIQQMGYKGDLTVLTLKNVHVPLDHFPVNALTFKVFSFMVKQGKHFSGKVTPLFLTMLVQPTEDEGEGSERQSEPQPTPSPPHTKGSGGNHRAQAIEIKTLKAQIKQLKKKARPVINHYKAWFGAGRKAVKSSKDAPSVTTHPNWDDLEETLDEVMDYTLVQDEGKTDKVDEKGESTAKPEDNKPKESTTPVAQTTTPTTSTPTPTTFGDDETIARVLLNMSQAKAVSKEKEKGVELKDVEDTEKKFKQVANDEEVARKVQEEWEVEEEKKRLAEEEATKAALSNEYDFIQARIEADRLLALRIQEEERGQFTVKERAKFHHDTIAAQRRFRAQQRSEAIRNKPPTKNQLRNQIMTYLKHVGNKKHADLTTKSFEEIKILYEKIKRFDDSFIAVGSTKDERLIKEINEGAGDPDKIRLKKKVVKEDDTAKVPAKQDVTEQGTKKIKGGHIKMIARKKLRQQPDVDSDDEHRECLRIVALDSTIDSEAMETKSVIARLNKVSSPDGDYFVIYRANGNFRAFNYLLEVLHIFNRQDLFHLSDLVMEQYSKITQEGIELILWGDLKIMMESSTEANDQELKDGTVIHMLVERRYPLSKELLQRMLDLGLEVEKESTAAIHLVKFIKQQLNEE